MTDDPAYVEFPRDGRRLDPGATRVFCSYPRQSPPRGTVHTDRHCPKLSTAWRLAVYPLADAVNGRLGPLCDYCAAPPATLRTVVREHDEHDRPVIVQVGLDHA